MPKVTKVNSFTTQPLNHLTTQLLSSFILAQRPCVFIERIKAPRDINVPAQTIGKNLSTLLYLLFYPSIKNPLSGSPDNGLSGYSQQH